jgi:hypothetical protein
MVTTPADDTHECPKNGCVRRVPAHQLMCPADWRSVPADLQSAVWRTWRGGRGKGTRAHLAAMEAAIDAVNGQETLF